MSGPPPHVARGCCSLAPEGSGSAPRAARAAWIKARKMPEPGSEPEVMLGWKQEVPWRGAGLRLQLQGPGAPLQARPAPHGAAAHSWSNFILQSQGVAGNSEPSRTRPNRARAPSRAGPPSRSHQEPVGNFRRKLEK